MKAPHTEEELYLLFLFLENKTELCVDASGHIRKSDSGTGTRYFSGGCLSCNAIIQVEAGQLQTGTAWDPAEALLPAAPLQGRIPAGKRKPDKRGGDVSRAEGRKQDVITTHL